MGPRATVGLSAGAGGVGGRVGSVAVESGEVGAVGAVGAGSVLWQNAITERRLSSERPDSSVGTVGRARGSGSALEPSFDRSGVHGSTPGIQFWLR